ncbi:hypothetical protein DQ238_06635 [Geodermatophilus sp. TF02-6]|uniref:ATP-binding protein n=1 Tax=Geodermatophilus sp. TF02-6 TaxID=2250575 RepID=UPI000DEBA008|nr:ATP-binding protein [Geodermatophilus sp. TF02-6]RBY81696.1 hypothetical protein DQ238_06635 [Geodermatophilus sp. TF02-6]
METSAIIVRLRRVGTDLADVEVKAAAGGLPKDLVETLSAFSNGDGGTILLGLDERAGFAPAPGFAADRIRDALVHACANLMEPPLRVPVDIEEIDGGLLVRADVPELDPVEKPCFVKARGEYQGSFIRTGDGDLRLTHYEITQFLSNRGQPTHDTEPVTGASVDDLDPDLVAALLRRVRERSPRSIAGIDDVEALIRLGALTRVKDDVHPTMAGLLALGVYPQQFFPQLFVAFVALPGLAMGDKSPDGKRFLDNLSLVGPLPLIVSEAGEALRRNMRSASVVTDLGRVDRYDYPLEVFRELLVNAVMHRDYSPAARGMRVQVELYPDRLVVRSPGGLFGSNRAHTLGTADQVSTSRNATLARLLADVELPGEPGRVLCENRGSGLPSVVRQLRQAGMSPPDFHVTPADVGVRVPRHALLDVDVVEWIGSLKQDRLTDAQHLALAMMRSSGRVTNGMLQAWGVDRIAAGSALRDLVDRGLATSSGGKRYASYELVDDVELPVATVQAEPEAGRGIEADFDAIKQAIRAGHTTARGLQAALGMSYDAVHRRLRALRERGEVEQTRDRNAKNQSYRIVEDMGDAR